MNAAFLLLSSALLGAQPPGTATVPAGPTTAAPMTSAAPTMAAPAVVSTGSSCAGCGGGAWAGGCGGCGGCDTCGETARKGLLARLCGKKHHEECGCDCAPAPVYHAPSCGCNAAPACGCDTCGAEKKRGLLGRLFGKKNHDECGCGCDTCGGGYGYGGCGGSVYGMPATGGTITTKPGEVIPAPKGDQKPLPSGTTPGTTKPGGGSVSLSSPYLTPTASAPAPVEAPRNPF